MGENGNFADAIGLVKRWPKEVADSKNMTCAGYLTWAEAYFKAAEMLYSENHNTAWRNSNNSDFAFWCGPLIQNVGMTTELILKALLRGEGKSEKELRKFSHNTYAAYLEARQSFDEVKFLSVYFSNSSHLTPPTEIAQKLKEKGEEDVDTRWRVYFDHLRILDSVYDRPYRTRYAQPGPVLLPEVELLLIGSKIFLSAMRDRLSDKAVSVDS